MQFWLIVSPQLLTNMELLGFVQDLDDTEMVWQLPVMLPMAPSQTLLSVTTK